MQKERLGIGAHLRHDERYPLGHQPGNGGRSARKTAQLGAARDYASAGLGQRASARITAAGPNAVAPDKCNYHAR